MKLTTLPPQPSSHPNPTTTTSTLPTRHRSDRKAPNPALISPTPLISPDSFPPLPTPASPSSLLTLLLPAHHTHPSAPTLLAILLLATLGLTPLCYALHRFLYTRFPPRLPHFADTDTPWRGQRIRSTARPGNSNSKSTSRRRPEPLSLARSAEAEEEGEGIDLEARATSAVSSALSPPSDLVAARYWGSITGYASPSPVEQRRGSGAGGDGGEGVGDDDGLGLDRYFRAEGDGIADWVME